VEQAIKIKNSSKSSGITLIEILVVIFIIVLFSSILVNDFPKIRRQFALTRVAYKMAQDLRRAQDMGLSGQQLKDAGGNVISIKSYGIYINFSSLGNKKYIIYADIDNNQQYASDTDSIIETIDFSQTDPGIVIKTITNPEDVQQIDINFKPPNPTIKITNLSSGVRAQIIFALESNLSTMKTTSVNTSGLIETK